MLDDFDIQHIKETRKQITAHRMEPVLLYKQSATGTDPFTGDTVYTEVEEQVEGTCKVLISQSGGEGEIHFENGVHVVTDDVILNLDIAIDVTGLTKVKRLNTEETYVVKAMDILGLGAPNRHFILLELVK